MTTSFDITNIAGRDGIRTRKNGEVAFANLRIRDEAGAEFDLSIKTQASDPDRPVFFVRQGRDYSVLDAANEAADAYVGAARAVSAARLERLIETHASLDAKFGPITRGTPKQIVYAQKMRLHAVQEYGAYGQLMRALDGAPAEQVEPILAVLPQLWPDAVFWIESSDLVGDFGRWLQAKDRAVTRIGQLLDLA